MISVMRGALLECRLQLPPSPLRPHFVKATVRIRRYWDGSLSISLGLQCLADFQPNGTLIDSKGNTATSHRAIRSSTMIMVLPWERLGEEATRRLFPASPLTQRPPRGGEEHEFLPIACVGDRTAARPPLFDRRFHCSRDRPAPTVETC